MNNKDFKKIFNMNTILSVILNYAAYIALILSVGILVYLSFIKRLKIQIDPITFGVFAVAVILLSFTIWNLFYKRRYEKVMSDDIEQHDKLNYSVHVRYYNAIKDWNTVELQSAIDTYNTQYVADWLNSVELETGVPIETTYVQEIDERTGKPKLDENNQIIYKKVLGIKDRPYKGFFHKILMWRIKHHKYPKSGYKNAIQLMSLFSYSEGQLNRRNLKADKIYFRISALFRLLITFLIVCTGASLTPDILEGNLIVVFMKLLVGLSLLFSSMITGTITGFKAARIKLSTVEDACGDLEKWANKKPIFEKYDNKKIEISVSENFKKDDTAENYNDIFTNFT